MDNQTKETNLTEKLESFLIQACQAETAGNNEEAERLFMLALRCEEQTQLELSDITTNTK